MRFTTELLPLLADHPWILVEVTGQPADYRAADDSLRIGVSTGAVAGDTDWFDLGVTILVEGHEIPFADLFLALSQGQTCLLLDDGAYFSLEKPELQALARLIEEARALQDAPPSGDRLRISRFQAGLWQELTEIGVVTGQAVAWERQVDGPAGGRDRGRRRRAAAARARAPRCAPTSSTGFQWLAFLWQHRLGGILADDMGLGEALRAGLVGRARGGSGHGPFPDPSPRPASSPTRLSRAARGGPVPPHRGRPRSRHRPAPRVPAPANSDREADPIVTVTGAPCSRSTSPPTPLLASSGDPP